MLTWRSSCVPTRAPVAPAAPGAGGVQAEEAGSSPVRWWPASSGGDDADRSFLPARRLCPRHGDGGADDLHGPLLAALSGGPPAGWVDRVGRPCGVRLGLGLMVVAVLLAGQALGPLGYLLPILLLTAGYALFQTANNSAVVGRRRGEPWRRGQAADPVAQPGPADGAAGAGACFAALAGGLISPSRRRTSWRLPPGPPSP